MKFIKQYIAIYFLSMIALCLFLNLNISTLKHPNHIGTVEIVYKEHSLQITTKLNATDLETALRKMTAKKVDLLNPQHKIENDSLLNDYAIHRLTIHLNSTLKKLNYIGYEKEDDLMVVYLEIPKIPIPPKKLTIDSKLLFDFLPHQTTIIHTEINSIKKSSKATNPNSKTEFNF